ncbi:MAG: MFS transporter [Actinomycetota bacterium]|nr:MFS transporter [Actinomycetota bacterium]
MTGVLTITDLREHVSPGTSRSGMEGSCSVIRLLRAERRFARWALAEGVSMIGTAASIVILPVLVYDLTGSAGLTGLVTATRLVPYLFLGLVAGPVADRGNRRRLIIGGNLAEGLLAATIPVAAAFDALTVAQVFVVAILSAVAFVFSDAAVFGAVPSLVPGDQLAGANGLLASLSSVADVAGPVLGGVLIATIGAEHALAFDSATFVFAAAVQLTIDSDFRRPGGPAGRPSIREQLGTAMRFVREQRTVLTLIVVGFGNSVAIGIVLGLLVPWSVEVLGYERDDARLGVLYAGVGVGSLVAGLLFPRLFAPGRVAFLTPASVAWSALMSATLLAAITWLAPVAVAAFSFGIMLTITIGITYRQLATPDHLVSTVNTLGRMIASGGQPLGAAVGASVAAAATVSAAATAVLTATAVGALLALRGRDTGLQSSPPGAASGGF